MESNQGQCRNIEEVNGGFAIAMGKDSFKIQTQILGHYINIYSV